MADTISLRPLSLRPGGGAGSNPFQSFKQGAGVGVWGGSKVRRCSIESGLARWSCATLLSYLAHT